MWKARIKPVATTLCIFVLIGCAVQTAPEPVVVSPRPGLFAKDSLYVTLYNRTRDTTIAGPSLLALTNAVRMAYPDALVRADDPPSTMTSQTIFLSAAITAFGVSFHPGIGNNWRGYSQLKLTVTERQFDKTITAWSYVSATATESNWWGAASGGDAARESMESAIRQSILFFDSLGTPDAAVARAKSSEMEHAEYAAYSLHGTATIAGQAFLLTRGGDVKRGAGSPVTIDPVTAIAARWYRRAGTSVSLFEKPELDSAFVAARRTVTADADGRFHVGSLPPGTYLVRSIVSWEVPDALGVLATQGGVVASVVVVAAGEQKEVILNKTEPVIL